MLNKVESKVMDYIFEKCKGEKKVLLTPKELLNSLMPKIEITAKELDIVMSNIVLDDYIESNKGEKDGRPYFVVGLTIKGAAYDRERQAIRTARLRSLGWRLLLAAAAGVVTWGIIHILNGWLS